jgi:hypothetical protein
MILPDTPFICKNIDVEVAASDLDVWLRYVGMPKELMPSVEALREMAKSVIAAALGEVTPVKLHTFFKNMDDAYLHRDGVDAWQPVVSDKE